MRAWQFDGGPDTLRQVEVATPEPGPGEVRLRVAACGVNPVDKIFMSGTYPVKPRPHIGGSEMAGVIDAVGPGVDDSLRPGLKATVSFRSFCGVCRYCLRGDEIGCVKGGILGGVSNGGFADYAVLPAVNVLPVPEALSLEDAASLSLSTATAWHMMVERVRVGADDRVVVFAASGGVGSAAVQIAHHCGARVVAVAGAGKTDAVRALGADVVFERGTAGLVERLREATGGGADVVCNPVGAGHWQESLDVLACGGRWTTCGVLTGEAVQLLLRRLYNSQHSLVGSTGANRRDLQQVLEAAARGHVQVSRWRVFPFSDLPQALQALDAPDRVGKIVLSTGP